MSTFKWIAIKNKIHAANTTAEKHNYMKLKPRLCPTWPIVLSYYAKYVQCLLSFAAYMCLHLFRPQPPFRTELTKSWLFFFFASLLHIDSQDKRSWENATMSCYSFFIPIINKAHTTHALGTTTTNNNKKKRTRGNSLNYFTFTFHFIIYGRSRVFFVIIQISTVLHSYFSDTTLEHTKSSGNLTSS